MRYRVLFFAALVFSGGICYIAAATAVHAMDLTTSLTVVVVPNAPSNFTAIPNSPSQVGLSWTDNANGDEDGFSVERKNGASGVYAEIGTTGAAVVTYIDNSAAANTTYFYRVRAFVGSAYSAYSNEASVTTPTNPTPPSNSGNSGGGSGGGGGGGAFSAPVALAISPTNVTISGSAYPSSKVFVLKDGQIALQTVAGPDGNFTASVGGLAGGNYTFSVYGEDSSGLRSTPFTFPVTITSGATTMIGGVFLSPTIDVDKEEVKQGDTIAIFGQSIPNAPIKIQVNSDQAVFAVTTSSASGAYLYDLDTSVLAMGSHSTKSKAVAGAAISQDSIVRAFTVGDQNVAATAATTPAKGDFNGDGSVNLVDFSMLAYWYGRPNPPAMYDLNDDGKINLIDFSIMAYYWTG